MCFRGKSNRDFLHQLDSFRRQGFELKEHVLQLRTTHIHIAQLIDSQRQQSVDLQQAVTIGILGYGEQAAHRCLHGHVSYAHRYRLICLFFKAIRRRRPAWKQGFSCLTPLRWENGERFSWHLWRHL